MPEDYPEGDMTMEGVLLLALEQMVKHKWSEAASVLRDALQHVLKGQRDMSVDGAVGDGAQSVREAERLAPHAILMGIGLPQLDGIEATRLIAQRENSPGVVILSPHQSPAIVRRALNAGALGYVSKDCPARDVVRALRAASAGRRYLGNALATRLIEVFRGTAPAERTVEELTSAEHNILRLVVEGRTNAQIAVTIGLSRRTVETYRIRMMRKLGVDNVATLVKYAIRHGLASLE
jgi:two-component system NarL family response regulator